MVAAFVGWIVSRLSPAQRLNRAISRHHAIAVKLPAGPTRDRFAALVDSDARKLAERAENWRIAPGLIGGGTAAIAGAVMIVGAAGLLMIGLQLALQLREQFLGLDLDLVVTTLATVAQVIVYAGVLLLVIGAAIAVASLTVLAVERLERRRMAATRSRSRNRVGVAPKCERASTDLDAFWTQSSESRGADQ